MWPFGESDKSKALELAEKAEQEPLSESEIKNAVEFLNSGDSEVTALAIQALLENTYDNVNEIRMGWAGRQASCPQYLLDESAVKGLGGSIDHENAYARGGAHSLLALIAYERPKLLLDTGEISRICGRLRITDEQLRTATLHILRPAAKMYPDEIISLHNSNSDINLKDDFRDLLVRGTDTDYLQVLVVLAWLNTKDGSKIPEHSSIDQINSALQSSQNISESQEQNIISNRLSSDEINKILDSVFENEVSLDKNDGSNKVTEKSKFGLFQHSVEAAEDINARRPEDN